MRKFVLIALTALTLPSAVFADDWIATKLRGGVFVYVDKHWVQLRRGETVSDGWVLRTKPNGRVTLTRGRESVAIGPDTQTQIIDRDGKQFTTVKQWYGTVELEAEVRDVQHFEVVNPVLAAVVKGTRFVVTADGETSEVEVKRGSVEVSPADGNDPVSVGAGQSVSVGDGAPVVIVDTPAPPVVGMGGDSLASSSPSQPEPPPPSAGPESPGPNPDVVTGPPDPGVPTGPGTDPVVGGPGGEDDQGGDDQGGDDGDDGHGHGGHGHGHDHHDHDGDDDHDDDD